MAYFCLSKCLVHLAKMAPKGSEVEFIKEKLLSYGYGVDSEDLDARVGYALNWVEDFEEVEERDKIRGSRG